ncbi:MAG: HAD hydrolase-like protein [Pseudomonadota bacterium]
MRTAVFDLDGTLADTSQDLLLAANAVLDQPNLSLETDRALAVRGGRAMLRTAFERAGIAWKEADIDLRYGEFLKVYARQLAVNTTLYPGVATALDTLQDAGWIAAICTNKPAALAEDLMQQLGLRDRFAALLGADTLDVKKPDPRHLLETISRAGGSAARAVLIGDSETDSSTAQSAQVPCILVNFGPAGRAVSALAADAYLDHFDDLPQVAGNLVPA